MDKELAMWLLGGLIVIIGWFSSRKIAALEKSDEVHAAQIAMLKDEKAALELRISENYIKRSEIKEIMDRIDKHLEGIYTELKSKADKD